jgi:hypothetical protein
MPTSLTANQLNALAQQLSECAQTELTANSAQHDPRADKQIQSLLLLSNGLANAAAATAFDDAQSAYQSLLNVTTNANNKAKAIAADVTQFSKLITIAAGMIQLAHALGSGNAGSVVSAIGSLASAIK